MKRDRQRTLHRRGPNGPPARYLPFADAFRDFVAKVSLPELAIDPNEVFGRARDDSLGRERERNSNPQRAIK